MEEAVMLNINLYAYKVTFLPSLMGSKQDVSFCITCSAPNS